MLKGLVFRPDPALRTVGNQWGYLRPSAAVSCVVLICLVAYVVGGDFQATKFLAICGTAVAIMLAAQEAFTRLPNRFTASLYGAQGGVVGGWVGWMATWIGHWEHGLPFDLANQSMVWAMFALSVAIVGIAQSLRNFIKSTRNTQRATW